jgi:hypothetical protein
MSPNPVPITAVAGRQGEGREINECYSETKKNQKLEIVTWRPEKGYVTPEVKAANKITCFRWCRRNAPFVLGAQPLDSSPLRCCWLA